MNFALRLPLSMFSSICLWQDFQEYHKTKRVELHEFQITELTSVLKKLQGCIHQRLLCNYWVLQFILDYV